MSSMQLHESQHHAKLMALGEMSATVIHEIRNALTTVLMGLHAMRSQDLDDLDQVKLRLSLAEAERIQRLLTQLLQYSKPSTNDRSDIELNSFVESIVESQRFIFATEVDRIHFYPSQSSLTCLMNRDKLKQILINLIANACEASPNDAVVTCRIKSDQPSNHACIEIHNWGVPIAADLLEQITQPYITTKMNGNGLGLFIVQQLIQEQEGLLKIQSSAENGTLISVTLPQGG
ncbi:MAG: ATP-binding protein [Cyanobacteria bacterium P01_F01_bin.42]